MTRTSAELLLLAALLAVAWMVFGQGAHGPAVGVGDVRRASPPQPDPVGNGLSERATRLRTYLAAPPPHGAIRRNPFSFTSARPAASARVERRVEVDSEALAPRPELTLSGIAEDRAAGAAARTAVIAADGQLVFAKEGDRVFSRFLVLRIAADAVQLEDTVRDEVFTLALK